MNAFASALATLHADTNLAVAARWRRPPEGWTDIRVIRSVPGERIPGLAGPGSRGASRSVDIAAADISGTPAKGDEVWIDGDTFKITGVDADTEGLSWRCTLSGAA